MNIRRVGRARIALIGAFAVLAGCSIAHSASDPPRTGPQTESRFPPLVVPTGFRATLFACDPLVEYPSVIALGPRPGTVLVAHDYMTGLGTKIVRRDQIRLVSDSDGDGYADKSTVFADGFNSIQGLAWHAGTVYAMHAPLLTALRDTDGDGRADERRDLLSGLGLPPEKNPERLHCANGVVMGYDGWLYLALGDHGADVLRPEGDGLRLEGGGILRCRPDGRDLHVFATGLRNIYDVALDEELNVFVRDNENDGGDYMVRVCHSFFGADHGYPYKYYERPNEAMPPLADLGRGSSAGGLCYRETAFPSEYRGNLFFCEWGRSVVRYVRQRAGASFAPMKEIDFATGAAADPYGFKPTDVIVDRDGSLIVSDWADGQRPKRGRGRLYRIRALASPNSASTVAINEKQSPVERLDSPSHAARVATQETIEREGLDGVRSVKRALREKALGPLGRMHAVWILAHSAAEDRLADLFALARSDGDSRVRVQAVRAVADLCDPALGSHASHSRSDQLAAADRLAELGIDGDPRVTMEVIVALGRLRWAQAPFWLRDHLKNPNAVLAHAAMQTLKRCGNTAAVLSLLDEPNPSWIRFHALTALSDRADAAIADGLIDRLRADRNSHRRFELADALSRIEKSPGPWKYWGFRPGPRPANTVVWARTEAIDRALDQALDNLDGDLRTRLLRRMQREQIPVRIATLARWLREERAPDRLSAILESLAKFPANETRGLLEVIVKERDVSLERRRQALALLIGGVDVAGGKRLTRLADQIEDGPVLVDLLFELGRRREIGARQLVLAKLNSRDAESRAAALAVATDLSPAEAGRRIPEFVKDRDARVRRAAAAAAGMLVMTDSTAALLTLCRDADPAVRSASLDSLRKLREPAAIGAAVAALDSPETLVAAIDYLGQLGNPDQAGALTAIAANNRSIDVLGAVARAMANWQERLPPASPRSRDLRTALADVQGRAGILLQWRVYGPLAPDAAADLCKNQTALDAFPREGRPILAAGPESRVELEATAADRDGKVWLAVSDVLLAEPARAQFLASASGRFVGRINDRVVCRSRAGGAFHPDADRFESDLVKGMNRIAIQLDAANPVTFHLRFRRVSSSAEQERLTKFALQNEGNAGRGREIFLNAEKSLCFKCHRIGEQGNRIGPNLTGVGERFSRIHLIESILEPSRTISPGYESLTLVLESGRVVTGVKLAEDDATLTLGDETGKHLAVRKIEIERRSSQRRSIMPDGLERRLTDREFLDLLTFLLAQKRSAQR